MESSLCYPSASGGAGHGAGVSETAISEDCSAFLLRMVGAVTRAGRGSDQAADQGALAGARAAVRDSASGRAEPSPEQRTDGSGLAILQARSPPVAHSEAVVATGVGRGVSTEVRLTAGTIRVAGARGTGAVAEVATMLSAGTVERSM
jgi:hypothetical protein